MLVDIDNLDDRFDKSFLFFESGSIEWRLRFFLTKEGRKARKM